MFSVVGTLLFASLHLSMYLYHNNNNNYSDKINDKYLLVIYGMMGAHFNFD